MSLLVRWLVDPEVTIERVLARLAQHTRSDIITYLKNIGITIFLTGDIILKHNLIFFIS